MPDAARYGGAFWWFQQLARGESHISYGEKSSPMGKISSLGNIYKIVSTPVIARMLSIVARPMRQIKLIAVWVAGQVRQYA